MAEKNPPPLAGIVGMNADQTEAIGITDFIFMSADISNAYLVNTADGHILINTGSVMGAERHKRLFAPVAAGQLRYVILTQSHPDHYGGLSVLNSPSAKLVVDRRFQDTVAYYERIAPYADERTFKLWEPIMGRGMRGMRQQFTATPDILVNELLVLELPGRRLSVLSVPGGETRDALAVHLPDDGIVFTGNLFGPAWNNIPNLYTIRGDKIRSALEYVASLERIMQLKPEILITGHGQPIKGAMEIRLTLARMRDAVLYIHDRTVEGMIAGKGVRQLMAEVKLPETLRVGQLHGKVSWNVRAIWTEYIGWFDYGSTTELYHVPASSVASDIVNLAGADSLIAKSRDHLSRNEPLQALHLLDIVLVAIPDAGAALETKKSALQMLLDASAGENLSETMWLKSEILAAERALANER